MIRLAKQLIAGIILVFHYLERRCYCCSHSCFEVVYKIPFIKPTAVGIIIIIVIVNMVIVVVSGFARNWILAEEELVGIVRRKDYIVVVVVVVAAAIIVSRILIIDMRCNFHRATEVVVAIDFLQI